MYLSNISTGMTFEVAFEGGKTVTSVFEGKIDHISFYAHCAEIFAGIDKYAGATPQFTFTVSGKTYTFTGEILGRSTRKHSMVDTFDVRIRTPFKEITEPREFRIETNMRVRIFNYVEDVKNLHASDWVCDAQANDISKKGIRLWSDYKLGAPKDTCFLLEFKLTRDGSYWVPAKLVRAQPNTATRSFNYEYGFTFDFSKDPERQERLLMDLLYAKINKVI